MFVEEAGEPGAMIAKLTAPDYPLAQHPEAAAALQDMKLLFQRLTDMGAPLHRFRHGLAKKPSLLLIQEHSTPLNLASALRLLCLSQKRHRLQQEQDCMWQQGRCSCT